jgi:phosphoglucosamine mutase
MTELFGTDGIRGEANKDPLVPEFLTEIGQALGTVWKTRESTGRILIGHDGRLSHHLLQSALCAGLVATGHDPQILGLCTTPALSYLCRETTSVGGIMISASHNPFHDNGIKPFQQSGQKFTETQEGRVEESIETGDISRVSGKKIGRIVSRDSWISNYIEALSNRAQRFPGHVVVDCANGGASRLAPSVLSQCTRELTTLNAEPNGTNINDEAGSMHPEVVSEAVIEREADLGFSLDGDGDRVIAVDENGEIADGDILLNLLARTYSDQGQLPGSGLVMTSMSNLGLRLSLERHDLDYDVVGVGDRLVYSKLKAREWRLGGEQSGHIIDRNWLPTGDGLHTIIRVMKALVETAKPLSEWIDDVEKFPQVLHNIDVERKPSLDELSDTQSRIKSVEEKLGSEGRVLVRYSGTEPVARIMLEGRDQEELNQLAGEIGSVMKQEIESKEAS